MSFDNQKKNFSNNNPIDFIEEYVLNDGIEKVRDSSDEIVIFSKGVLKNYYIKFLLILKYFLIIFGLLFVAYYPIAIGMAIYVGGLYWLFSKDNPIFGCIWAGLGCYISAFIVHNLIQLIS